MQLNYQQFNSIQYDPMEFPDGTSIRTHTHDLAGTTLAYFVGEQLVARDIYSTFGTDIAGPWMDSLPEKIVSLEIRLRDEKRKAEELQLRHKEIRELEYTIHVAQSRIAALKGYKP